MEAAIEIHSYETGVPKKYTNSFQKYMWRSFIFIEAWKYATLLQLSSFLRDLPRILVRSLVIS